MRYEQIWDYISDKKPEVILEVGTWNGNHALRMLGEGAKRYVGFDVWGEGSDELDEIENNVKKRVEKSEVEEALKDKDVELIEGNTRVTLPEYVKDKKPFVDMAFIDGGHSAKTIKSDLLNVLKIMKTSGVIFLDDYYFLCPTPDIGAQVVCAELNIPYTVLPKVDKVKGGYLVKIAKIDMTNVPRQDDWEEPDKAWRFER